MVTDRWTHDNAYAYQALKAAEVWAVMAGEDDRQYRDAARKVLEGINEHLYNENTHVWFTRINESGKPYNNDSNEWINYAPRMLDVPARGVDSSQVGEWIHKTLQKASGAVSQNDEDHVETLSPGFSFQASLAWFDLKQSSYAEQAINWAENSGLWCLQCDPPGGWIDWIDNGIRANTWERYIDTSFYAIAAWNGGYDFSIRAESDPTPSTCDPSLSGVILYSEQNYNEQHPNGRCSFLTASHPNLGDLKVGNDTVSSVRINGDYRVRLYPDPNYQPEGVYVELNESEDNLDKTPLVGKISSVTIKQREQSNICNDEPMEVDGICLYSEPDRGGSSIFTTGNIDDLEDTILEGQVRSAETRGNYSGDLFTDSGANKEFRGYEHDLRQLSIGDQFVRLVVKRDVGCTDTSQPGLYVYDESNFKRNCAYITDDVANLDDTPVGNNAIKSWRFTPPGRMCVFFFEDKKFSKRHDRTCSDNPNFNVGSLVGSYESVSVIWVPDAPTPSLPAAGASIKAGEEVALCWEHDLASIGYRQVEYLVSLLKYENDIGQQIKVYGWLPNQKCVTTKFDEPGDYGWQVRARQIKGSFLENPYPSNWSTVYRLAVEDDTGPTPVPDNKQALIAEARERLANELGVSIDTIELVSIEPIDWPDTSYGCPEPGKVYPFIIIPGYIIILQVDGTTYKYHTGTTLNEPIIRCDSPTPGNAIHLEFSGPASVTSGQTFIVMVQARGVPDTGLYGAQLDINYDSTKVSASNLQVNPDFTFVPRSNADNANGKIELVLSRQGNAPGLTGDVTLLTFDLTTAPDASGDVTLTFTNVKAGDRTAAAFDVINQSYTVSIEGGTPEPTVEPTTEPTAEPTVEPTVEPTTEPTVEPTTEPTVEPTVEPVTATISGQVTLHGRNTNWSGATVTVDDSGQSATTNATGNFNIPEVTVGSHTSITADAPGYLPAVCNAPTITASETTLTTVNLLSGDLNDDRMVDINDATTIGVNLGLTGSNLPSDINKNGIVDIFDIILLSVNFGQNAQVWNCLGG